MNTRATLVASARTITLSDGIDALTMRRVAKECGLGTMTAYRHFANKESLLGEIAFEGFDLFCDYFYRALSGPTPADRLWLCGKHYLDFATQNPRYYEAMFTVADPATRSETQMATALQFLTDRVAEARDEHTMDSSWNKATALSLFSHCHGMVVLHLAARYDPALDFPTFFKQSLLSSLVGANLVPADYRPPEETS
ncbi:MAG: TetR/AcrR family transcriptional regulator [Actinomycetia bacterium]|nr:TetR/AcrR family transcriptional regulator [Actinomycetes bacterium]